MPPPVEQQRRDHVSRHPQEPSRTLGCDHRVWLQYGVDLWHQGLSRGISQTCRSVQMALTVCRHEDSLGIYPAGLGCAGSGFHQVYSHGAEPSLHRTGWEPESLTPASQYLPLPHPACHTCGHIHLHTVCRFDRVEVSCPAWEPTWPPAVSSSSWGLGEKHGS